MVTLFQRPAVKRLCAKYSAFHTPPPYTIVTHTHTLYRAVPYLFYGGEAPLAATGCPEQNQRPLQVLPVEILNIRAPYGVNFSCDSPAGELICRRRNCTGTQERGEIVPTRARLRARIFSQRLRQPPRRFRLQSSQEHLDNLRKTAPRSKLQPYRQTATISPKTGTGGVRL